MIQEKKSVIRGRVYIVGDNIDTDQIIPAQYLNLVPTIPDEYRKLGSYALSGLPSGHVPFVKQGALRSEFNIVIAGCNFGCGSSREHAPIALGAAGIRAVVAESYARIFFRKAIATGELYPYESYEPLVGIGEGSSQEHENVFHTGDLAEIDLAKQHIIHVSSNRIFKLKSMGDVAPVIEAGGIFEYARKTGMIK